MRTSLRFVLVLVFGLTVFRLYAFDFNLRLTPVAAIPIGSASTPYYSLGGGAFLNADIDLFHFLSIGPEIGYYVTPLLNTGTYPTFFSGGLGIGSYFYPASRVALQAGGSGGVYEMSYDELSYSNLWWKAYGDVGFRISPSLTLSGGAGYLNFRAEDEPMYTGILAGIGVRYFFRVGEVSGSVTATLEQPEPVFPLLYGLYSRNSIGTLTIHNGETAEIRNVSVGFRADAYTSSQVLSGTRDIIRRNGTTTMPLYAEFSERIQNFTESGVIRGELEIKYELLGAERVSYQTLVIPVHNRNTVRWTDPAVLASFVSPNSPEVLDFSKYIVGIARNSLRTGLNRNMQFAMYLLEGMNVAGISYSNDDTTPYVEYHRDPTLLDYIQYPFQTLAFRLGDYDDLGLLYAAALESVGIRTAIIPLRNDFIVAFSLEVTQQQAEALFDNTDRLLTIGNDIWMPLSFTVMREGFMNSWNNAVTSIEAAVNAGDPIEIVVLRDAWATYPPSGIRGQEAGFQNPPEARVDRAVETNMLRYIATEFGPKIREVEDEIARSGGSTQLYNRLGVLYVRAGLYNEARQEFAASAELGSLAAMINLGNIELLDNNFTAAGRWFREVLEQQPENQAARTGLERVEARTLE